MRSHRPEEPEIDYINVDSRSNSPSKMSKTGSLEPEKQSKRNPIVNGVKNGVNGEWGHIW